MPFGSELISGAINASRALPTTDLRPLFDTINKAGAKKTELINQLPEDMKAEYAKYTQSLGTAGQTYEGTVKDVGQTLLEQTKGLYDPNSAAVQATLAALKMQDYSTLPGTLTNLKAQLAAGGGLDRGGASKAIAQAVRAPAETYAQQAANVIGQQLTAQQTATQAALNKVASMDENVAQQLFGMSKEQATQILTSGRSDLKDKLTGLVNNIDTQTQQTLDLQGFAANEAQKNALTRLQQKSDLTNQAVNTGSNALIQGLTMGMGGGAGTGLPAGADVGSASYLQNALAMAPK